MAVRRKLTSIRLDKIAAVDRPCQQHATVAIIKREPVVTPELSPALAIAKKTFEEALNAQLVGERISETFWRAFENQWAARDAFRTALTDELSEGGDGTVATEGFLGAMKTIATAAATAARDSAAKEGDMTLESAVEESVTKWLNAQEHTIMDKAALIAAIAKYQSEGAKPSVIVDIKKAAVDLGETALLPVELAVAPSNTDDIDMLKSEIAILKMDATTKAHYDGLTPAEKKKFMALSVDDQKAKAIAKNADDPVVFKTADGIEIRKSAGDLVVMLAKKADAQAETIAKLEGGLSEASIAKRAAALPHVPNAEALLKAADLIADDGDRAKSLEAITAMNKALAPRFSRVGAGGGNVEIEKGADTPEGKMSAIVKRVQTENPGMDIGKATIKASEDPEFQALYAETLPAPQQA
jgi:hypothetical protein